MSKARNLADLLNNSGQITAEDIGEGAAIPSQTGQSGKYLTTDGSTASWEAPIPSQTGQSGKYLTTDGSDASWGDIGTTFPFYKADGNSDTITITSGVFPFYKADGSQDNIGTA